MCNDENNNHDNNCNCLRDILKIILILQRNASPGEKGLDTCDKRTLGRCCEEEMCNTRPVTLYTAFSNGQTPWRMPISKDPTVTETSSVFRIEKIDDCCCTFRVLVPVMEDCEVEFEATDSFFTININCICAIKCLEDTFVECV